MNLWISLRLLAQAAAPDAAPAAGQPSPIPSMLILFVPVAVIWFVMFILPQNKERARRQEMLNALKRTDAVVTVGGILGSVSHISDDGKEVTLKIDDNARIKVQRDAIREVVRKDSTEAK